VHTSLVESGLSAQGEWFHEDTVNVVFMLHILVVSTALQTSILSTDVNDLRIARVLKEKENEEQTICDYLCHLLSDTEWEALAIYCCLTQYETVADGEQRDSAEDKRCVQQRSTTGQ
jgi:hypothetical protein